MSALLRSPLRVVAAVCIALVLATAFNNCGQFQSASSGGTPTAASAQPGATPSPTPTTGASLTGLIAQINWTAPAGGQQTSYNIQSSTDGTNYSNVGTAAGTATSTQVGSLVSGTTYYFRISAVNSAGQSGWSQVTTLVVP